jgi:hypothetical protein
MFDYDKLELISNRIANELPKIDGVEWSLYIDRTIVNRGLDIQVVARFQVDGEDVGKELPNIYNKIHQIVSAGQVKLELEGNDV